MQVLCKHVRGLKEMLILLMLLGGWGVQRQNDYIAYVKNQNSYSPKIAFKSVKYYFTLWSKVIYEKIIDIHP